MKTTAILFLICVSFTSAYAQGTASDYERAKDARREFNSVGPLSIGPCDICRSGFAA